MSDTIEIRPDDDDLSAAEFLTGSTGAAMTRGGGRIERRNARPRPGWYVIHPKFGARGPFPTAQAARGRR
jgi:hypothetical protein